MVGSNTLGWMEFMIRHGMQNTSIPREGILVRIPKRPS